MPISASAAAAREQSRRLDGRFGEQPLPEGDLTPTEPQPLPWAGAGDGTLRQRPLYLNIEIGERWDGGDPETTCADVATVLHQMDVAERKALFEETNARAAGARLYERLRALQPGWPEEAVDAELEEGRDLLAVWLDDNPAWEEDGHTEHPSGGYLRAQTSRDADGTQTSYWDGEGRLHRLDGPAFERHTPNSSTRVWQVGGQLHRIEGPAIEEEWWDTVDGEPRRTVRRQYFAHGHLVSSEETTTRTIPTGRTDGWYVIDGRLGRNANWNRLQAQQATS